MSIDIRELARKVRDEVIGPKRCTVISQAHPLPSIPRQSSDTERFELFHHVLSICSQKVRNTLAEKGVTYGSNELIILPPQNENYSPQYVRLRLLSDAANKLPRATSFTGHSAVDSEGFDPMVVPLLVDYETGSIVADSKAICMYLCRTLNSDIDLIPHDLEEKILAQLEIVDSSPHVALMHGVNPDGDRRPASIRAKMPGIHKLKIASVERNIPLAGDDPQLLAAYQQKITKEKAFSSFVLNPELMRSAIARNQEIIVNLDRDLGRSGGDWLFGDRFTLADLFWGVSLNRYQWMGYAGFWTTDRQLPRVEAYANRLFARSAIQSSIIQWPGHHPTSDNAEQLLEA